MITFFFLWNTKEEIFNDSIIVKVQKYQAPIHTTPAVAGVIRSLKGILQLWKDEYVFKMGHLCRRKCSIIFEFGAF